MICWGLSEMVFAGFSGHGGAILNGKRSFKVTLPPSEARSERSEVRFWEMPLLGELGRTSQDLVEL